MGTSCDCSAEPSGGVFTCEDGVPVYIPKPAFFAVLVSDPNSPLPFWARPSALGLNCPGTLAAPKKKTPRKTARKK